MNDMEIPDFVTVLQREFSALGQRLGLGEAVHSRAGYISYTQSFVAGDIGLEVTIDVRDSSVDIQVFRPVNGAFPTDWYLRHHSADPRAPREAVYLGIALRDLDLEGADLLRKAHKTTPPAERCEVLAKLSIGLLEEHWVTIVGRAPKVFREQT